MEQQYEEKHMSFYEEIKEIFEKNYMGFFQPLSRISFDMSNREALCDSGIKMFNYDELILKTIGSEYLKTPDAVYFAGNRIWFIEFKNGYLDTDVKRMSLKLKGIEGCYIGFYELILKQRPKTQFKEIMDLDISYFVVYNAMKNKYFTPQGPKPEKNATDKKRPYEKNNKQNRNKQKNTPAYDRKTYRNRVRNRIIFLPEKIGLQRYKGTFFQNTGMISDSLFEKKLLHKICALP